MNLNRPKKKCRFHISLWKDGPHYMPMKVKVKSLSRVRLFATPWAVAYQAPPSMGFPGKSAGVGCHCLLQHSALHDQKADVKNYMVKGGLSILCIG